jgi:aspartate-semialdehyde dehydrogenase
MEGEGLEPLKVGILGATGMVGQRFVMLLASHPFFQIHVLGASFRSVGRTYAEAAKWRQSVPIPDIVRRKIVQPCEPQNFRDCAFVFSGLDSDVAGDVGESFALDRKFHYMDSITRACVCKTQSPLVDLAFSAIGRSSETAA